MAAAMMKSLLLPGVVRRLIIQRFCLMRDRLNHTCADQLRQVLGWLPGAERGQEMPWVESEHVCMKRFKEIELHRKESA